MSSTVPYMFSKSEHLCYAARNTVSLNFERLLPPLDRTVERVKLLAPKRKQESLPPRFNLKNFPLTAKILCNQLRKEINKRNLNSVQTSYANNNVFGLTCESSMARRPYLMVLNTGNVCPGFSWEEERITEKDILRCIKDFKAVKKLKNNSTNTAKKSENSQWEKCLERHQITIWRKPLPLMEGKFEYRVFGRFHDITARDFYKTQIDNSYRMEWDSYAIKLMSMDKDPISGTEVVHWITKFPYPMKSRDYVFVRRHKVLPKSKAMVIVSKACDHPYCPESSSYVRVTSYTSKMVIKPHRTFDDLGCDYVLMYHDDPGGNISSYCINMVASAAIPEFVKKLHKATLQRKV